MRQRKRERWLSRLHWDLAPVCGSIELMCHPDPEGADSNAGEEILLMLHSVCYSFALFMTWDEGTSLLSDEKSTSNSQVFSYRF